MRNSRLKFEGQNLLLKMVKDVEIVHKWSTNGQVFAQIHTGAALITMETTATTTASSMARASPPEAPSKSPQFKFTVLGQEA